MPDSVSVFRFLIIAGLITGIAAGVVDSAIPGLIPAVLADAQKQWTEAQELPAGWVLISAIYMLVMFIGAIASTIGLFVFKPWARSVALWVTLLSTPGYLLLGAEARSGWSAMLEDTSSMMWGGMVAMAYFSDLRSRFETGG